MDRKEFYRELMETYTVDTEKIKCSAKRKAVRKNGSNTLKWVACTAACTAAAAAIVTLSVNMQPKPGVNIAEPDLDSAIERVYAAEQRYRALAGTNDVMDMFVSFEEEHTLNEILMAFSSVDNNGEIKPSLLYTSEGKYYKYNDKISGEIKFRGAKITASAKLFEELNRLKIVSLAEPVEGSRYTDKSFVPYVKKDVYEAVVTSGETIQISLPNITASDSSAASETQPSEVTTVYESGTTDPKPVQTIKIPAADIKTAQFINNEKLIVTTSDSIRLYKLTNGALLLETTFYAESARITYSDPKGKALFITACDANGRNRLYYAEGEAGVLSEIDISSITVGNAEIAFVSCSSDGGAMIFKTVSPEKACIYYAKRNGGSVSIGFSKEYTSPVSVISHSNGIIYTAVTDSANAVTKIYAVNSADGSEKELASYSEALQFNRNISMDTAAFTVVQEGVSKNLILTPEGAILEVEGSPVFSAADSSVLKLGEKYFRLEQGVLTELDEASAGEYFAEPEYPYTYKVDISQDGTAELIAP